MAATPPQAHSSTALTTAASSSQSNTNEVLLEISQGVATITLNRPKQGNAINNTMLLRLIEILQDLPKNPNVRVIVLTGAQGRFCSGMDLSATNQTQVQSQSKDTTDLFISFCEHLKNVALPVISLVNGPVLGGGNVLVFLSDIRIMLSNTFMQFSEVYRGLVPAMISCYIIPRAGTFAALDLFLTGRKISGTQCLSMGLVSDVAKDETELQAKAREYIGHFMNAGPSAVGICKKLIHHVLTHTHEENVTEAKRVFTECVKSSEMKEGIKAFKEKRKPSWATQFELKPSQL